ncbi:MAG TPA: hypothetical protein VJ001_10510 [Rhodocyclaceae bacterium]|nr:hypothetical protein [Rhodocyclaceae bacterium]
MTAIAERIQLIERMTNDDKLTLRILDKLIRCLADDERRRLAPLDQALERFEQRYRMSTEEFQRRFSLGELGDDQDFFEWDAIGDMAARLRAKLAMVREADLV